ncbi:MAG: sensor histidine kinase [Bacteroidales bacterium]
MRSKQSSFRLGVVLRIILILTVAFSGFFLAVRTPFWLVSFWLGVLLVVLVMELIRFHERSVRALRRFLLSVRQGDFASISTADEKNTELHEAYRMIRDQFLNLRIEKETNYHYLKRVIEHVDTALICLRDDTRVELINRAATDLLQISEIQDVSALAKIDSQLTGLVTSIRSGQREMIRVIRHGRIMKLSVRATEFSLDGVLYKIVSMQDIKSELEEQELESWQKLVRVLTHEIMNSAIPITNMVSLARKILLDDQGKPIAIPGLTTEEVEDLMTSLSTAESRSEGLSRFVQTTRSLTQIQEPVFEVIRVSGLFTRIREIFKKELAGQGIKMSVNLKPDNLEIKADSGMLEQVIINLIRNAMDALKATSAPVINLTGCRTREGGMAIQICDNGQGISNENMDHIFVPFYSTKKEGSGIGLSLSLQIMKLHKGRIDIASEVGEGTCVSLVF